MSKEQSSFEHAQDALHPDILRALSPS